jgi:multidrug efflux system membrane fusion protein
MITLPHRRRVMLAGGIVALLVLGLGVRVLTAPAHAADKPARSASASPVQVTTAAVQTQDVPIYRSGIGVVTATATVTVKSRIDGQLDRVGFVEGQDVKAGQVLARLDPRTLEAQLAQAQAQRARDQAQLGNARVDLARYTRLIGEDAASQQQVDTQKALVAQLEAAVRTDEAQVTYAQVQLSFTTISAPMNGRVGARLVDPGNIVHATDANGLVVINQIDPISVVFTLPEEAVQDIFRAQQAAHQPLVVEAFARTGNTLLASGKLVLLNNQIDTTTGTVQLKGSFANASHALWPGQFVNVRLQLGRRDGALTVPEGAVQRGQDGTYAYVVDAARTVKSQALKVALIQDGIAVIDKGVQAGERVVVAGQYKLKPGSAVVEAGSAGSGARTGRKVAAASTDASGAGN